MALDFSPCAKPLRLGRAASFILAEGGRLSGPIRLCKIIERERYYIYTIIILNAYTHTHIYIHIYIYIYIHVYIYIIAAIAGAMGQIS